MKAQSSLEFLAMISMSLVLVGALYGFVTAKNAEAANYQNSRTADRIAQNVAFQVEMALVQGDGYSRVFSLPESIAGEPYNVTIEGGFLVIDYRGSSLTENTLYNGSRIKLSTQGTNTFRVLNNGSGVFLEGIG